MHDVLVIGCLNRTKRHNPTTRRTGETAIFGEKDALPSPSSPLLGSSCSTLPPPYDANEIRMDYRYYATRDIADGWMKSGAGHSRGVGRREGCAIGCLRHPLHSRFRLENRRGESR